MLGVGCLEGGRALEGARARGWDVAAVEFSPILAHHARTSIGIEVDVARAWDLAILDGRRALLAREGCEVVALRTHLRAPPLDLGRGARRWLQGPIHALGGLVERGPCIEIIARRLEPDGRRRSIC